jgi:hypothetical protein
MYEAFIIGLLIIILLWSLYNITLYYEVCQDPYVTSSSHLDLFYVLNYILFSLSSISILVLFILRLFVRPQPRVKDHRLSPQGSAGVTDNDPHGSLSTHAGIEN